MGKRILILGAGVMQGVAIREAKAKGWHVTAVDGNPEAPAASLADRFEPIDLKDELALRTFALALKRERGLDGVFTAATDFSASVASVAEACGLPGHSLEAARDASDKVRMRTRFKAAGVPSPRFCEITASSVDQAAARVMEAGIAYPLVVKPCDNMGARGCRMVEGPDALMEAVQDAVRHSRTGRAIAEEYMEGPEFSFEALVFDGEFHMTGMADRHIYFPPYFIEMGHTIPSRFPHRDLAALETVFRAGASALGLTWGAVKGDLKLTPKGPMVGEIAGRLSGGYMSGWTFPYSSGVSLTSQALDLACGIKPTRLAPTLSKTCAERAWISIPGQVATVEGVEEASAIPGVRDVFPRVRPGERVAFPRNNVEKAGNVLAVGDTYGSACRLAVSACQRVFVRLMPHDPETDGFLAASLSVSYPPSAFAELAFFSIGDMETLSMVEIVPNRGPSRAIPVPASLIPFLDTVREWHGVSLRDSLALAFSREHQLESALRRPKDRSYALWRALIRGGIQGIVYEYDCQRQT